MREAATCPKCGKPYRLMVNDEFTARAPCCDEKLLICPRSKRKALCGAVRQILVDPSNPREILAKFCAEHAKQDLLDDGPLLSAFEEHLIDEVEDEKARRPPKGDPHSLSGMFILGMYRIGVKSQVEHKMKKIADEVICTACYHPHTLKDRFLTGAPHASKKPQVWTLACPMPKCRSEEFRFV